MPPGRPSTGRASPPPGGRLHSIGLGSPASVAVGSGRAEVNSSEPSGAQTGEDSPGALRVSRRAGRAPAGSTSHSADCHFFFAGSSVATETASREPSTDSASAPIRGSAAKSASRANGPDGASGAGSDAGSGAGAPGESDGLTGTCSQEGSTSAPP